MFERKYCKLNEFAAYFPKISGVLYQVRREKVKMNPPTGSFFCHPQKLPRKRQWERGHVKKGLWFSDRWGGFIWLQRLPEPFRLSFGSVFPLSVVQAKHVIRLGPNSKPTPAVANKRSQQCYFLSVRRNVSMAISPPFLHFSPCFSVPFWHSFLLVALFCTQCPVALESKKLGSFPRFLL